MPRGPKRCRLPGPRGYKPCRRLIWHTGPCAHDRRRYADLDRTDWLLIAITAACVAGVAVIFIFER